MEAIFSARLDDEWDKGTYGAVWVDLYCCGRVLLEADVTPPPLLLEEGRPSAAAVLFLRPLVLAARSSRDSILAIVFVSTPSGGVLI